MNKSALPVLGIIVIIVMIMEIRSASHVLFDKNLTFRLNVAYNRQPASVDTLQNGNSSFVEQRGSIALKEPTILQRMIWPPDHRTYSNVIESVFMLYILVHILFIFRNYKEENIFRNDIFRYLNRIGRAYLALAIADKVRWIYLREEVFILTDKEFTLNESVSESSQLLVGVALVWLSWALRKGYRLQREQDLTI